MAVSFEYLPQLDHYDAYVVGKVERFVRFAKLCGVEIEPFQRLIVSEFFAGRRELVILIPRGNGKTTLLALLSLFIMCTEPLGKVVVAASKADQAKHLFEAARDMARITPALKRMVKFRYNYLECEETGGSIKFIAADKSGRADGFMDVRLYICDELHAHVNSDTYDSFRSGVVKRDDAQLVNISTAGVKRAGKLYELRQALQNSPVVSRVDAFLHTATPDGSVSLMEWSLPEDSDPENLTLEDLRRANPATFKTDKGLQDALNEAGSKEVMAVKHANVWIRIKGAWLPAKAWSNCLETDAHIPDGSRIWCGIDIGDTDDHSALVALWEREDGKTVVMSKIWVPDGDGTHLDAMLPVIELRKWAGNYRIEALVMDRWNFGLQAQMISDEGIFVADFKMSGLGKASKPIYEAITTGQIVHNGDPLFANHVTGAVKRFTPDGWRIGKAGEKIDALIAMAIAFYTMKSMGTTQASTFYAAI